MEASNKKSSVNMLKLELKNIKNDTVKNFKKSKITQKTPKSQKFKKSKSHVRRPHIKKFRTPTIEIIEKY